MSGEVYPLVGEQRDAVNPRECVWLSASAGTGKTQVLSARVLRLLLRPDTHPSEILCLTFTKAGAAEMATRVNQVLARWVRLDNDRLGGELAALGAPIDPDTRARARSLFASVLDCPGGGLRIDTIHAFSQYLLGNFPEEAGLLPGSRPMEDRERDLLSRKVLTKLIEDAERDGDVAALETIAELSRRRGRDAVMGWLMRCAGAHQLWSEPPQWTPPFRPRLARLLGVPADADEGWLAEACSDAVFPVNTLRACLPPLRDWQAATGQKAAAFIDEWLAMEPIQRLETLDGFFDTLLKKDGTPRVMKKPAEADPSFELNQQAVAAGVAEVSQRRALLELLEHTAPALELGRKFAILWDEEKEREGLIDFDDQIRRAALLLRDSEMASWIRYKLDRRFDHILIDEAQDTNADQWAIIRSLIDDFFDGLAAHEGKARTIFTVGDYKQAIFGFQGTSPENFRDARNVVRDEMAEAADNADALPEAPPPRYLREYGLNQSFRTAAPVLDFVDAAVNAIGPQAFGLNPEQYDEHVGEDRPGLVTLWNTVTGSDDEEEGSDDDNWLAQHDRQMADRIAIQIESWMREGFPLVKGEARNATPGDIMVLVRKRRELAALIVARLHARGVPVAGVDRLRIGNPLAVKDLMAALRFAAQPLDDLSLANLLVSPLGRWSQQDLLDHGYRPQGARLWDHIRGSDDPMVLETVDRLRALLAQADFESPMALLHWLVTGPFEGRQRLVARLGSEANDPIDELLNAAHAYASAHTISLQGFIRWFDAGDGEIKREAGEGGDQVRVMTVHGSKGLQSPIVILADAAGRPDSSGALSLEEHPLGSDISRKVPLPSVPKGQTVGPLAELRAKADAAELEEHWRLLYVAMTRAEEELFIGGSLSPRERGEAHPDSWYARLKALFAEEAAVEDANWGARWEWGTRPSAVPAAKPKGASETVELPDWALRPIGEEPRPPRPLAPSGLGDIEAADPPLLPAEAAVAARRGVLIHSLLERLPDVAPELREERAQSWLSRHGADFDGKEREEILAAALRVLNDSEFAPVFSIDALAEASFTAVVDGQVVAGTVDRLLVEDDRVQVIDFKTTRRPPQSLDQVPKTTMQQMAAYEAAIRQIYPDRRVEIAVLYTQTPALIALPQKALAAHKSAFSTG